MKWEYLKQLTNHCDTTLLNKLGEESWELVCVCNGEAIFKRRKVEEKAPQVVLENVDDNAMFEECWIAYNRRGSKALAKAQWAKLSDDDKTKVLPHIKEYVASVSEVRYQVYFERYLRDKRFLDVVHSAKPQTLFSEQPKKQKEENKIIIGGVEYK